MARKLICGVGVNDAEYKIAKTKKLDGKRVVVWMCPFYSKWICMIGRCYSSKFHEKRPTYADCKVCDEWLTFSNFKAWMEKQEWQGKELDKDILVTGNRVYCKERCMFVDKPINSFFQKPKKSDLLEGVSYFSRDSNYRAQCENPFTGKNEHLGYFNCEKSAHQAWRKRKHEIAILLAKSQKDTRVIKALTEKYA